MSPFGKPLDRVDGRAKVTGAARYAVEYPIPGVVHAVIVGSAIARGTIERIDTTEAERAEGVLLVLTHQNAMKLPGAEETQGSQPVRPVERVLQTLQDAEVHYSDQPIAVVVADTLERAQHAANLVKAHYRQAPFAVEMEPELAHAFEARDALGEPSHHQRGDVEKGLAEAEVKIEARYTTPPEHHNPMEMHATTAVWEGDRLTLYDSTQGIFGCREKIARSFGIPADKVRVIAQFVGGGFGSKGSVWSHVALAAMAAKQVGHPVRLMVTRQQMFAFVGFRPRTLQNVRLGATADGTLTAIEHHGFSQTSRFDVFVEPFTAPTKALYACPNASLSQKLVRLDTSTPQFMRAPGEATGTFALESAMDELAVALDMDPIELRLRNYAEKDPSTGKPWSSKMLKECYRRGAERFHWARRTKKPRSMKDGRMLVGMGMATATYPAHRQPAAAAAWLFADGTALVRAGTQDIGTGTFTVMTQIAADQLGLPMKQVRFELGDTTMPPTPVSGGSMTAASTGSAVHAVSAALLQKVVRMAISDSRSPLHGAPFKDVISEGGRLFTKKKKASHDTLEAVVARSGMPYIEERVDAAPGPEMEKFAARSFGAQFCEVHVDPDLGMIRVARWVGVFATGRIINPKLARSQFLGGIVFGIGMGLLERSVMDPRLGRFMTRDLADYHVPVNADIPDIDIVSVDESDGVVNPIGVKGIGEIGITGCAAALANAVFHATGKRIRDLPITLDKLL